MTLSGSSLMIFFVLDYLQLFHTPVALAPNHEALSFGAGTREVSSERVARTPFASILSADMGV